MNGLSSKTLFLLDHADKSAWSYLVMVGQSRTLADMSIPQKILWGLNGSVLELTYSTNEW